LDDIHGNHSSVELQMTAILGTAHIWKTSNVSRNELQMYFPEAATERALEARLDPDS
jgi:hypothetical protein